jgi:hypothetical protein
VKHCLLALLVPALAAAIGCSDPEKERLKQTTRATYDQKTGRLKELTYDTNKNGKVDTWTEMDGSHPIRARIDRNEDGKMDRWEYYDPNGKLVKVGFSRADDGKPDAWAFSGPDGKIERAEISSTHDEKKIDRWERYAPAASTQEGLGTVVAAEEDSNRDGRPDKWETYESGALKTVAFDGDYDGKPDRRLTYDAGVLMLIETQPDGTGAYGRQERVK